ALALAGQKGPTAATPGSEATTATPQTCLGSRLSTPAPLPDPTTAGQPATPEAWPPVDRLQETRRVDCGVQSSPRDSGQQDPKEAGAAAARAAGTAAAEAADCHDAVLVASARGADDSRLPGWTPGRVRALNLSGFGSGCHGE
ncbi:unnamed protein product, partial [Prorocentrum cordatum]